MTWMNVAALAYVVIGLSLAAWYYHVAIGGGAEKYRPKPCDECGVDHRSAEDKQITALYERLETIRSTKRGRIQLAISTAVACVVLTFAWPAALVVFILKGRKTRGVS
ncbi:MAG TPA: hypothetical protein VKZ89_17940 [Thermobifida alba]|nr:hypothetical protein [Thermobifida alba]